MCIKNYALQYTYSFLVKICLTTHIVINTNELIFSNQTEWDIDSLEKKIRLKIIVQNHKKIIFLETVKKFAIDSVKIEILRCVETIENESVYV